MEEPRQPESLSSCRNVSDVAYYVMILSLSTQTLLNPKLIVLTLFIPLFPGEEQDRTLYSKLHEFGSNRQVS